MPTRKPAKPQSSEQSLQDALLAVGKQQKKRQKHKQPGKGGVIKVRALLEGMTGKVVLLALLGLVALVVDGVRRESKEFKATVVATAGRVTIVRFDSPAPIVATTGAALKDSDLVRTAAGSGATLTFPDGTAIQLEANTEFEVRLLDYTRDGRRDRCFMVRSGSVLARIGSHFGTASRATVCTPTAVAAVRGTAFRVAYQPAGPKGAQGSSTVEVVDGQVEFRTPLATTSAGAGQSGSAAGYALNATTALLPATRQTMQGTVGKLRQHEQEPGGLQQFEFRLNNLLDPALQLLGICPGGWGYGSIDAARRTATQEALRLIQQKMEMLNDAPKVLNPVTLAELELQPKEQRRILSTFAGYMLDSYKINNQGLYRIRATSRDKARTRWELTNTGVARLPAK